jgi:hypothetical protein
MVSKSKWLYVVMLAALSFGLLALLSGCPDNGVGGPAEDGIITVEITGAGTQDGEDFISAVLAAGANPYYDDAIGLNTTVIVSGTAQGVALDLDNWPTPFTFTGGTMYDVYGLIDLDGSGNPTVGDYLSQELGAEVDGDMVFVFFYPTDFAEITSIPAEGTLTIGLTAAGVVEGKRTMFAVFDAGANPYTDTMLATNEFDVVSGTGSSTAAETLPPYLDWLGTGGNSYDVYLWVDIDGDSATVQYPESGVDMRLKTFPVTVEIDGNITLTYSGTDLETVP